MLKYLVFIVHITVYLQMVIMSQYVTCEVCNKKFKFVSNTHLKLHNLTTEDYKRMYPNSKFKTDELIYETGKSLRGKTYEDVYGVENANKIKMQRSLTNIPQDVDNYGFCKTLVVRREVIHIKHIFTEVFVRKTIDIQKYLNKIDWNLFDYMEYMTNRLRRVHRCRVN